MTIDEKKGMIFFNAEELDEKTLFLCKAWLADLLTRFKTVEQARTKAQTERNKQTNKGLSMAVDMLEVLEKHRQKKLDLDCFTCE